MAPQFHSIFTGQIKCSSANHFASSSSFVMSAGLFTLFISSSLVPLCLNLNLHLSHGQRVSASSVWRWEDGTVGHCHGYNTLYGLTCQIFVPNVYRILFWLDFISVRSCIYWFLFVLHSYFNPIRIRLFLILTQNVSSTSSWIVSQQWVTIPVNLNFLSISPLHHPPLQPPPHQPLVAVDMQYLICYSPRCRQVIIWHKSFAHTWCSNQVMTGWMNKTCQACKVFQLNSLAILIFCNRWEIDNKNVSRIVPGGFPFYIKLSVKLVYRCKTDHARLVAIDSCICIPFFISPLFSIRLWEYVLVSTGFLLQRVTNTAPFVSWLNSIVQIIFGLRKGFIKPNTYFAGIAPN